MLLLLAVLAQGAPTTDLIDVTAESPVAADETCRVGGPYTLTPLEAEAVFPFTLTTEELGNLQDIEIRVRAQRQNCLVEIDEIEIYLDSTSLYLDATLGLSSVGDGSDSSVDWRIDETYIISDIVDEIVSAGDHEIRAVLRGAGDNDNTKIEVTITAEWEHGADWDSDGYADDRLSAGDDCDDDQPAINPGAVELWYDGIDQDCDAWSDFDQDFDGFDSSAETAEGTDCDDLDEAVNTGATEAWYDGVDQDCDGWSDYDQDLDGFDSSAETAEGTDCDDLDEAVNPGATEVWYDGTDQDCDGWSDYDQDLDGFDSSAETAEGTDCDDLDEAVNPGATEVWYDGIDQDCDGRSDFDRDLDGFDSPDHGGSDCDDDDATVYPGARNWSEACEWIVRDDGSRLTPQPPLDQPAGCTCDAGGGAGSLMALSLLPLLLVRRRRHHTQS